MCLVNDAVYIAKYKDGGWTATGTQFAVPYVYKTLFSKEPITFEDLCETKSVTSSLYLDMNENLPDVEELEKVAKIRDKGPSRRRDEELLEAYSNMSDEELEKGIAKGHNYIFIGRIGQFCPILEGRGGGLLMREKDGKYYSVTGTKGYRWLESEMVNILNKEDDIDMSYYEALCDAAISEIGKYGNFEEFVNV
jgi:asparagine synthetase A